MLCYTRLTSVTTLWRYYSSCASCHMWHSFTRGLRSSGFLTDSNLTRMTRMTRSNPTYMKTVRLITVEYSVLRILVVVTTVPVASSATVTRRKASLPGARQLRESMHMRTMVTTGTRATPAMCQCACRNKNILTDIVGLCMYMHSTAPSDPKA